MATKTTYIVGILIVALLITGIVYVTLPGNVKLRVDNDKSTFYVLEDSSWKVSGREYNSLWDGTSKMNRISNGIKVETFIDNVSDTITIKRTTPYIRGPVIVDTYFFEGNIDDVELFPISHTVDIYNGSGFIYQYEVRDLVYDGETIKNVDNPLSFGRNMKVSFDDRNYWSTVYKSGILKVRYRPIGNYDSFEVRLFDPVVENNLGVIDRDTYDDGKLPIELREKQPTYGYNYKETCTDGVCTRILYQNTVFGYEDGHWKPLEELKSFKGTTNIECVVKSDGIHNVECLDYNSTARLLNFSIDVADVAEPDFVPIKVEKEDKSKEIIAYRDFSTQKVQSGWYEVPENEVLYIGENSTTVELQTPDTENVDDGSFDEDSTLTGAETTMYMDVIDGTGEMPFIKFDVSDLAGAYIEEVNLTVYAATGSTQTFDVWRVADQNWKEETLDALCSNSVWCSEVGDLLTTNLASSAGGASSTHITIPGLASGVQTDVLLGNHYTSFALNHTGSASLPYLLRTKEYTTSSYRPKLIIVYTAISQSSQSSPTFGVNMSIDRFGDTYGQELVWKTNVVGNYDDFGGIVTENDILYLSSKNKSSGGYLGKQSTYAINITDGSIIWEYAYGNSDGTPLIDPDGDYIYINYYDGYSGIHKLNKTDGTHVANYSEYESAQSAILIGEYIYDGARNMPVVFAINKTDMTQIWNFTKPDEGGEYAAMTPAYKDDGLIIGFGLDSGGANLYKINATTGEQIWNVTGGFDSFWDIQYLIEDDVVYAMSAAGFSYYGGAFNYTTGENIWNRTDLGSIYSQVGSYGDRIWVGGIGNRIFGLNKTDGSYNSCRLTTDGDIYQGPAIVKNGLFFAGSLDNKMYLFNTSSCETLWSYETGDDIFAPPAVSKGMLYFKSDDFYLRAFDVGVGTEEWKKIGMNVSGGAYCEDCLTEWQRVKVTCQQDGSQYNCTIDNNYDHVVNVTLWETINQDWYNSSNDALLASGYTNLVLEMPASTSQDIYLIFSNQPPLILSSRISPTPSAQYDEDILGYCNATDINNVNVTYEWRWYNNTVLYLENTSKLYNYSAGIEVNVENISNSLTSINDNWTLECVAYDWDLYSSYLNSSDTQIVNTCTENSDCIAGQYCAQDEICQVDKDTGYECGDDITYLDTDVENDGACTSGYCRTTIGGTDNDKYCAETSTDCVDYDGSEPANSRATTYQACEGTDFDYVCTDGTWGSANACADQTCAGADNGDSYLSDSTCVESSGCSAQVSTECSTCETCSGTSCVAKDDNTQDTVGSNTCDTSCEACQSGSCSSATEDTDPGSDCGTIQCDDGAATPYYYDWVSLTCYYAADVDAGTVACDGSGSCKVAADYCLTQGQGDTSGTSCECTQEEVGCDATTGGSCSNCDVTTSAYNTYPNSPDTDTDITFNITCADDNAVDQTTGYVQIYNDSVAFGSPHSTVVTKGTNTLLFIIGSGNTSSGENWTGEYWCYDGTVYSTKVNDTSIVSNQVIGLSVNGFFRDVSVEVGSPISIYFTRNTSFETKLDIDYPSYGVNYSTIASNATSDYFTVYQETADALSTSSPPYFYANYTKPVNVVNNSVWRVKHGTLAAYNITIPTACWDAYDDKLVFRMYSDADFSGGSYSQCYDGSSWNTIGSTDTGSGTSYGGCGYYISRLYDGNWCTLTSNLHGVIYEEAMVWNVSTDVQFNIDYFYKNTTNNDSSVFNISYNDETSENQTFYISAHSKDEVQNLSFNITGYETDSQYPNINIYIGNVLSNSLGWLFGADNTAISEFYTGVTELNTSFTNKNGDLKLASYFKLPSSANVSSATFDINGSLADYLTLDEDKYGYGSRSYAISTTSQIYAQSFVANTSKISKIWLWSWKPSLISDADMTVSLRSSLGGSNLGSDTIVYDSLLDNGNYWDMGGVSVTPGNTYYIIVDATAGTDGYFHDMISNFNYYAGGNVYIYDGTWHLWDTGDWRFRIYGEDAPANVSVDIGVLDGSFEWNMSGDLTTLDTVDNLTDAINTYLGSCTADGDGFCSIPLYVQSDTPGLVTSNNVEINYSSNINPIYIDLDVLNSYLAGQNGSVDIPIMIKSTTNGTVEVNDIQYKYLGGNYSVDVVAHNDNYSYTDNITITYYYSDWDYDLPPNVDGLWWFPPSINSKNVSPFGQTNTIPLINITSESYGGKNLDVSLYVDQGHECALLKAANNSDVSTATGISAIPATWYEIIGNLAYGSSNGIWMWADYDCDYSNYQTWEPNISISACCDGCDICSND